MQVQKYELNYSGHNIYVGIDVHLKSWTVTIRTEHFEHKRFTQPPDAQVLYNYLNRNFPGATYYSVYEAGFCGFWVHRQLESFGIHSIVTNPADVPTKQKEKIGKDDPVDSRKLARSLSFGELDAIYAPSVSILEDRALVRIRATIVKDVSRYKQRIKAFLYFFGIHYPERFANANSHWSKNFLRWLKDEVILTEESGKETLNFLLKGIENHRQSLLEINRKIRSLSTEEKYADNVKLLMSVPGIGLTTAMTFLTEIETIERFENSDFFAGYVGLVPTRHGSGEVIKTGEMTFRGQTTLKKSIVESAWIAVRIDPALSLVYNKLVKRMEPNKAIIRIARKLLNRIFYVLKNKKKYVTGIVK